MGISKSGLFSVFQGLKTDLGSLGTGRPYAQNSRWVLMPFFVNFRWWASKRSKLRVSIPFSIILHLGRPDAQNDRFRCHSPIRIFCDKMFFMLDGHSIIIYVHFRSPFYFYFIFQNSVHIWSKTRPGWERQDKLRLNPFGQRRA